MATDYDAPRKQDEDLKEDSIEELQSRRSDQQSGSVDEDEATAAVPPSQVQGERYPDLSSIDR